MKFFINKINITRVAGNFMGLFKSCSCAAKFVLVLLSIALIGSCKEDFVERYPTTSTVVESFYSTTENATQGLTAAYNMLLRDDWWSSFILSEIASDNCVGGGGSGDGGGYQRYDRGLQQPESSSNQTLYTTYYGGIFRANAYLEGEKNVNWTGKESLRLQYQAEARFLRAYYHFYLTRFFGEVPALDHIVLATEVPSRTPAEDMYKFIIEDLEFCAKNGLADPDSIMKTSNWCRATKWSAEAMIARVFLFYTGYYNKTDIKGFTAADAKIYLDDIINNSGHALVTNYASLWVVPALSTNKPYAGERNSEVVWSVSAFPTVGKGWGGNAIQRMIGMRGTNVEPYGQGWGAMPVRPDLWDFFDAADTRRDATINNLALNGITYDFTTNQQAQYTGFQPKKYELKAVGSVVDPSIAAYWQTDGPEDHIIIRFADVLLMGAEFELNAGNTGQAAKYVNMVRERAFGDATHNLASVTIDDIFKERKLELACEGIRYFDILRSLKGDFTKLASILTYIDNNDGGDYSQTSDSESLDVDGNNFVSKKGLFQLPQAELELMKGTIKQNPGYN